MTAISSSPVTYDVEPSDPLPPVASSGAIAPVGRSPSAAGTVTPVVDSVTLPSSSTLNVVSVVLGKKPSPGDTIVTATTPCSSPNSFGSYNGLPLSSETGSSFSSRTRDTEPKTAYPPAPYPFLHPSTNVISGGDVNPKPELSIATPII